MKMTMDDFTEPVDLITRNVVEASSADYDELDPVQKQRARQGCLSIIEPGMQHIIDTVNARFAEVWAEGRKSAADQTAEIYGVPPHDLPNPYA